MVFGSHRRIRKTFLGKKIYFFPKGKGKRERKRERKRGKKKEIGKKKENDGFWLTQENLFGEKIIFFP